MFHATITPQPGIPSLSPARIPSPDELSRVDLGDTLRDPDKKAAFVAPMFEHIAPRYDDFTRLFSLGMDKGWKQTLIEWLSRQQPAPDAILDVACGTGDLALASAAAFPRATVIGIDAAQGMVDRAALRGTEHGDRVSFTRGDLSQTNLSSSSQDAILAGYAFRNVARLDESLNEMARVLKTGGMLYTLDFYKPANAFWRRAFLLWLKGSGSAVGWWWHRAPVMYAYIADSIDAWLTGAEFQAALGESGFTLVHARSFLGGGIQLHAFRRN